MPLYRHTKAPPPPELGEKTIWDYLPRRTMRRVVLLLLALVAVLFLKRSGSWSLGGLLDAPKQPARGEPDGPIYHIKVTRPDQPATKPTGAPTPKSAP